MLSTGKITYGICLVFVLCFLVFFIKIGILYLLIFIGL